MSPSSTAQFRLKSNKFNILCTPKVHRRLHNSPQLLTAISQINLKRATPFCVLLLLLLCSHLCLCLSSSLFPSRPPKPLKHSVLSHTCHSPRTSVQPQYNLSHQPLHHKLTLNLNFSVQVSFLKLACLLYKQQLLLFAVHDTEADRPPLYVASKQLVGIH